MRNGAKGSMVSGSGEAATATDTTTRHRKGHGSGHKRKLHQQSSTGVSNVSVVPYSNNNNGVAISGVSTNNIINTGSSRSHSKHGGNNRKSHSIKHKSSKVQIPLLINANNVHSIKIQQESRQEALVKGQDSIKNGLNVSQIGLDQASISAGYQQFEQYKHRNQVSQPGQHSGMVMKSAHAHINKTPTPSTSKIQVGVYEPNSVQRNNSKHKHRKLSKAPSGVISREVATVSPHDRKNPDNQFFKLQTTIKGVAGSNNSNKHQSDIVQSAQAALDSQNIQQMIAQNSFNPPPPEFIISGQQHQSATSHGYYSKHGVVNGTAIVNRAQVNASDDKQARTFNQKSAALQMMTQPTGSDTRLSNSGKFVISTTQNQHIMQQQIRQQQNFKQHLQSVNLEVKGTPAESQDQPPHQSAKPQSPSFGPKQVTTIPQNQINQGSNLKSVPLQQVSPKTLETPAQDLRQTTIYVQQNNNSTLGNSPMSLGHKVLMPSGGDFVDQHIAQQQNKGLQNSKSPFKAKQSHKLIKNEEGKWTRNIASDNKQNHAGQHTANIQNSATVVVKKKHSAKNSIRKQSANQHHQQPIHPAQLTNSRTTTKVTMGQHPRNSMPIQPDQQLHQQQQILYQTGQSVGQKSFLSQAQGERQADFVQLNSKTLNGASTKPLPINHIKVVPTTFLAGQQTLKQHQSNQQILGMTPENNKIAKGPAIDGSPRQDSQGLSNFYFPSSLDASKHEFEHNQSESLQNLQGLLTNMSKQRVYTMDADQGTKMNVMVTDQATDSSMQIDNTGSKTIQGNSGPPGSRDMRSAHTNSMVPKELKSLSSSPAKRHHRSKHGKRSESQTENASHQPPNYQNYPQGSNSNSLVKQKSQIAAPGYDVSFQKSGKQIVQGQHALFGHHQAQQQKNKQMEFSANSSGNNKTLPLSIFEMQFYQGEFFLGQQANSSFQASGKNSQSKNIHPNYMNPNQLQPMASAKVQANSGGPTLQQQFLSKNGVSSTSLGSMVKGGASLQELSQQQQMERQKVNFVALQNFHQQWLSQNGSAHVHSQLQQHHQSMPLRNSGGSQNNLGVSKQQSLQNSPMKTSGKHGGGQHSGIASAQTSHSQQPGHVSHLQGGTMQTLLQKQKGPQSTGPVQTQIVNSGTSSTSIYGGPVQVNGRQMQVPHAMVSASQQQQSMNYSQIQNNGISTIQHNQPPHQHSAQQQQQRYQNEIQQAYLNGLSGDALEFIQNYPGSSTDVFSHQLYAMQLQQHQQALNVAQNERNLRRRDTTNNMFKRAASKIPFENAYVEDCYKFIIGYGNNSGIIRNALKQRNWWIEIQPVHSMFNFKWNPTSEGIKFGRLGHIDPGKREQGTMGQKPTKENSKEQPSVQDKVSLQMVNHFEHHQLLTEKYNLLMVMQRFCDLHKENTFDLMPITFFVEIPDASRDHLVTQALTPFATLYQTLEANKDKLLKLKEQLIRQLHHKVELEEKEQGDVANGAKPNQNLQDRIQRLESVTGAQPNQPASSNSGKITKFKAFNFDKRTYQKYTMPLCHFDSYNLWLLKPTHLNRGRGIHVFRDLDTLNKLIKQYCIGKEEVSKGKKEQPKESPDKQDQADLQMENAEQANAQQMFDSEQEDQGNQPPKTPSPTKTKTSHNKIKHNTFIIQKYIERPLLIYRRKFDIRVWVLLNQDQELFFFKEGYLRTSSTEFGIDLENIDNAFVHLTNNAVQKHAENYGDFEDGNQLSFQAFQDYIEVHYPESGVDVYKHLVPQMHEIILKTFNAVRRTIDPNRRKFCFELFGYDFILDDEFNQWLIEVNTNPCLEESSELLKRLLPRMIEDMLKLTVDVAFPKSSIRRRKDFKKSKGQAQSPQKKGGGDLGGSPQKRVSTANKLSVQLESSEEVNHKRYKMGGTTDTEQTPLGKGLNNREGNRSKTNSTDANNSHTDPTAKQISNQISESLNGDFTSQAAFSQSIPDSDINKEDEKEGASAAAEKHAKYQDHSPLMTIKEKLNRGRVHPVAGYSDSENMWFKLANLEKDKETNVNKYPNSKSLYTIQVHDKTFKLRKNPMYTGPMNLPELQPDPAELLLAQEAAMLNAADTKNESPTGDEIPDYDAEENGERQEVDDESV